MSIRQAGAAHRPQCGGSHDRRTRRVVLGGAAGYDSPGQRYSRPRTVCEAHYMDRIIRAALEGDEAEPGRVAAADVARLVLGLQTTLRRAAFSILGRFPRAITGGRYEAAIEDATRLKFVAVEPGSFVSVLALPEVADGENTLAVDVSLQDLGYRSFHRLLERARSVNRDRCRTDARERCSAARRGRQCRGSHEPYTARVHGPCRSAGTTRGNRQGHASPNARHCRQSSAAEAGHALWPAHGSRLRAAHGPPTVGDGGGGRRNVWRRSSR